MIVSVLALIVLSEPLRLRADVLGQARDPAGVLVLQGQGTVTDALTIDVLVWGNASESTRADILVGALRYRDPAGHGELTAGRMLLTSGGLLPLHLDGLRVFGRAPSGTTLELFGGVPVVPRFDANAWDWALGGRVGQSIGNGAAGIAYLQQRSAGQLDHHEIALDFTLFPLDWLDVGARGAYDLVTHGVAEIVATTAATAGAFRFELSGLHRSPARLLPATSLFSVLGDATVGALGARVSWSAAPRLDLSAGGGARWIDDVAFEDLSALASLRLGPDRTSGSIGAELRRQGAPDGGWSGVRLFGRTPLVPDLSLSSELELVRPDHDDRGDLWLWGLVALAWSFHPSWDVAAAFEASSSAESEVAFDAIARLGYQWW